MSASNKKKLRKEENAEQLTKRQQQEQKEAKKTKLITSLFIVGLALILVAFAVISVKNLITSSGIVGKMTTIATVGEHKITLTDFNYYYVDLVNETTSEWYSSAEQYAESMGMTAEEVLSTMMGIDVSKPLTELIYDEATGQTWADYLVDEALAKARRDYILYDAAKAAGFELSEEDQATLDGIPANLDNYAQWFQAGSALALIRMSWGYGDYATVKSYVAYNERTMIADSYYEKYSSDISFTDAELRAHEGDTPENYNSYSYAYFNVEIEQFLEGGTTAEDGTVTYSDEEKAAAKAKAEAAANKLAGATTVEEFDELVTHVYIAEEAEEETTETTETVNPATTEPATTEPTTPEAAEPATDTTADETQTEEPVEEEADEHDHEHETSIKSADVLHSTAKADFREWLASDATTKGSTTVLPMKEGEEVTGYYAVFVMAKTDNNKAPVNVRHLLVQVTDTENEEAWTAAQTEAETLLNDFNAGDKSEDSFIELVKNNTDDTASAETGGLYEGVRPTSSYVDAFLAWCVDDARKAGDVEIVKTEYGYHIMYFVEHQEQTYRDQMISGELRTEKTNSWMSGLTEKYVLTKVNVDKIDKDMISLSRGY